MFPLYRWIARLALTGTFLLLISLPIKAQSSTNRSNFAGSNYQVQAITSPITLDGSLNELIWQKATPLPLDYEIYPQLNTEPIVNTEVYVTYDRQNLYVAFRAQLPDAESIRAHFMDRDQTEKMLRDDHVGFTIDPFNTGQWAYRFRINALGVQADAIYNDQTGQTDYSWDTIWASEGQKTPGGYVVEVRIPFNSLSIPSDDVQKWRFRAYRSYPRNVRHEMISHRLDVDQQSRLRQFHQLEGFENLSSGLNLELNPTLTANRSDERSSSTNRLQDGSVSLDPGFNLNWGIKPNLNLATTVNPDFSQIEADALRLRENERFVLSFPEKRPFFLEGSEIFETPLNAVFTRSVIEPVGGLKFTGKQGAHTFGTFVTRDRKNRMVFPSNQSSNEVIEDEPIYSEILRYRRRLSSTSSLGFLAEGRQSQVSSYHNYVTGIDGFKQFWRSNTVHFQYLRSSTNYPVSTAQQFNQLQQTFAGDALTANVNHSSEHWVGAAAFESISSDFRNDNGFFPRVNYRSYDAALNKVIRGGSDKWFSRLQFGPSFQLTTDQSGGTTDQVVDLSATYNGPLQSEVFASVDWNKRRVGNQFFEGMRSQQFFFRFQPAGILSKFRVYVAEGEAVDFTNIRKARQLIIHPGLNFNMGERMNIILDPNFQRLSHNGEQVFATYLLGTQFIYHFSKQIFTRAITQFRYVDRNLSKFNQPDQVDSSTESFFYQLLFSYKLNPQSKFFLGYSSGYGGINNRSVAIQSRTGFLKLGYAWVF